MADDRTVTVGVDIGTTSVKAVAADEDGHVLASTRIDHPVLTPSPGVLEHDAGLAWRDGVRRAATDVAAVAAASGARVGAVNVAAMVPSLCAVDAEGVPVSPGLLYGDRRAVQAAVDAGDPPSRGLSPAEDGEFLRQLRWMAAEYPDAAGYWPAQAVANAALCGTGVIDSVTAMTAVPVFDYLGWDASVCGSVGVTPEELPDIVSGSDPAGKVDDSLGEDLAGAVVGGGSIDAFSEQLVAGADDDGDVLVIVGATLITWAVIPDWHEAPGLWTVPHTAPGKTLIGGPSNAGGIAKSWAGGVLLPPTGGPVDAGEVPVFLPHVRGERVPLHDPGRRGGFLGLSVAQGPDAMWRAVHEASGFTVRRNLELAGLLDGGDGPGRARRIVATGGGSADEAWMQAMADTTGLPVERVAEPRGGALGAAFSARAAAGLEADLSGSRRWARPGPRNAPDPAWTSPCNDRYRQFVDASGPPFDPAVPG